MAEFTFWTAAGVLAYTLFGYPLLAWLRARVCRRDAARADVTPSVTIVIVAHNEAAGIGKKLQNLHQLDYPREKLEIIVASDGSDDGTNDIVERDSGVTLLPFPRQGKIPALNQAAEHAKGELLVFSDANSMYATDALRWLVRAFADPNVGGVAGNQTYVRGGEGSATTAGERAYWNFDQKLKEWQSAAGSVTSATGAIYAIRRSLFRAVPPGVGDDAVISYRVIAQQHRFVYEPRAVAYETVAPTESAEFKRKVRVCLRGLHGLTIEPQLFNPLRHGFYSVQLASHKLLRWIIPWPLLLLLISSFALFHTGLLFQTAAVVQATFYFLALLALVLPKRIARLRLGKAFTVPYYFCLANVAFISAQLRFARGQKMDRWDVRRAV